MKMDWTIFDLKYTTTSGSLSQVATEVVSKFEHTISGISDRVYHRTYLPSVTSADFINWDSLNENSVKGWVESIEGNNWGSITSSIETSLSQSINEINNPPTGRGKPW
tara:strand:+ start:160 stop:483 length:324 start_codon:yes stop_codon:yes gene_type:complete